MTIKYTVTVIKETGEIMELKEVVGDGIIPETRCRFFLHADGSRTEVPTERTIFEFSKERSQIQAPVQ